MVCPRQPVDSGPRVKQEMGLTSVQPIYEEAAKAAMG
jgi:hypothetical protein